MKIIDYHAPLRCWRVISDDSKRLHMLSDSAVPKDADEKTVLAEAERVDKIATTPEVAPVVDIEKDFTEAVDKYVAAGGKQAVAIVSAKTGAVAPIGGGK